MISSAMTTALVPGRLAIASDTAGARSSPVAALRISVTRFSAGEVALEMRYDLEGPHILIVSPIAKVPRESKSAVFSKLLELNYGATLAASGSVGYDADEELLMYVNYISLVGLESASFGKFVHRCVDAIEHWHAIAKASASGRKN